MCAVFLFGKNKKALGLTRAFFSSKGYSLFFHKRRLFLMAFYAICPAVPQEAFQAAPWKTTCPWLSQYTF